MTVGGINGMSKPDWGGKNGIWYPLIWRVLDLQCWWPAARFIKGAERNSVPVDIYLGVMWLLELIVTLGLSMTTSTVMVVFGLAFAIYRIADIVLVLLSELVRGHMYPFRAVGPVRIARCY